MPAPPPFDFPASPTVGQKWPSPPVAGLPIYIWDGEKWTTQGATVGGPGGTFTGPPEAPLDGKQYARKNAAWAQVDLTGLVPEAPADGRLFGRKDAGWVALAGSGGGGGGLPEAPIDGVAYNRKNAAWVPDTGGGGGTGTPGPAGPYNTVIYVGNFF